MKLVNSRLMSLIRKEFIQIARDPRTLALVILMPIMQLLLLGYAATNDVRNVPMAVYDQDKGPAARELLDAFRAADYFSIQYFIQSEDEMRSLIETGTVKAVLVIPPDYSAISAGGSAQVALVLDGSDPSSASTTLSAARLIAQTHATQIQTRRLADLGQLSSFSSPLELRTQVWYNPDLISAYFMVPGVIASILYAITSILTATTVVRERERGTIEQLIVTPIRSWELIVGKLVPYVFLAFLNTLEVLALGSLLFHVPIRGSLMLLVLLCGLFLLTGLGIGLVVSTFANNQQEAMLLVFMLYLPSIFLSGFLFPLEAMPRVLQWVSYALPMRYFLVIIRSVLLKSVSLAALQNEVLALAAFAFVIMSLAVLRFRKRLD